MNEFEENITRYGGDAAKSTDPSSSDERDLKNAKRKEKVVRKTKRLRRKKKTISALKKSSNEDEDEWNIVAQTATSGDEIENAVANLIKSPSSDGGTSTRSRRTTKNLNNPPKKKEKGEAASSSSIKARQSVPTQYDEDNKQFAASNIPNIPKKRQSESQKRSVNDNQRSFRRETKIHMIPPVIEDETSCSRIEPLRESEDEETVRVCNSSTKKKRNTIGKVSIKSQIRQSKIQKPAIGLIPGKGEKILNQEASDNESNDEGQIIIKKSIINTNNKRKSKIIKASFQDDSGNSNKTNRKSDNEELKTSPILSDNKNSTKSKTQNEEFENETVDSSNNSSLKKKKKKASIIIQENKRLTVKNQIKSPTKDKAISSFGQIDENSDNECVEAKTTTKYVPETTSGSDKESESEDTSSSDNSTFKNKKDSLTIKENKRTTFSNQNKSAIKSKIGNSFERTDKVSGSETSLSELNDDSVNKDNSSSNNSSLKKKKKTSIKKEKNIVNEEYVVASTSSQVQSKTLTKYSSIPITNDSDESENEHSDSSNDCTLKKKCNKASSANVQENKRLTYSFENKSPRNDRTESCFGEKQDSDENQSVNEESPKASISLNDRRNYNRTSKIHSREPITSDSNEDSNIKEDSINKDNSFNNSTLKNTKKTSIKKEITPDNKEHAKVSSNLLVQSKRSTNYVSKPIAIHSDGSESENEDENSDSSNDSTLKNKSNKPNSENDRESKRFTFNFKKESANVDKTNSSFSQMRNDENSDNDRRSRIKSRTSRKYGAEDVRVDSDQEPETNSNTGNKEISSEIIQHRKQSILGKQNKSPIRDKTPRKSMKTKTDCITIDSNAEDSKCEDDYSFKNSSLKNKKSSVIARNDGKSIVNLPNDDSFFNVTAGNSTFSNLIPQLTSTEIKQKRKVSNSFVQNISKIQKRSTSDSNDESPKAETILNETFTSEDPIAAALKEFRFKKEEPTKWTDAKSHTFCGVDIPAADDDEKRGTYNLERSVIDLGTLRSLEDTKNEQGPSKRSSIGQRITKKHKPSPKLSPKLSTTLKAKTKLKEKKSHLSKHIAQGVLNGSKKNVTFNESTSANNVTKIKPTKMPNFSKIHQRHMDRSESILEYVQRTQERAQCLLSGGKSLNANKVCTPKSSSKDFKKQLNFTPIPSCSNVPESSENTARNAVRTLQRMDAFDDDLNRNCDKNKTPQKKKVTYSSPADILSCKSPKTYVKTPGSRKYMQETFSSVDASDGEYKLPTKSPRSAKTPRKTFENITPKKLSPALVGLATKIQAAIPGPSRKKSPNLVKTPKRVSPIGTKKVLIKSPKSPIVKILPAKLFHSKTSKSQKEGASASTITSSTITSSTITSSRIMPSTSTSSRITPSTSTSSSSTSRKVLVDIKPKHQVGTGKLPLNKASGAVKKTTISRLPKQIKKENNINVNNIEPQPSSSSGISRVEKANKKGSENVKVKEASKSPQKKVKTRPDKEALKMAANKTRVGQPENVEVKREALKGLRSNRRFDLLMKFRNKK